MKLRDILKLGVSILVCESAGAFGAIFTSPAIKSGWYASLAKPAINPPAWLFGPVWITLYALMGISLFLIWRNHSNILKNVGMSLFFIQLALNSFWLIIFFGWQNPGAAFADIILLWLAILATIVVFYKISKPAAWLLIPYILWVSFAVYLNFSIWQLNAAAQPPEPIFCTQDAKLCPDGSYVSRVAPKCDFAPCPKIDY